MPARERSPLSVRALDVIQRLATEADLTQSQLADLSGITQPQISRLYNGRATLKVDDLAALCHGLGVTVEDVVREASAP